MTTPVDPDHNRRWANRYYDMRPDPVAELQRIYEELGETRAQLIRNNAQLREANHVLTELAQHLVDAADPVSHDLLPDFPAYQRLRLRTALDAAKVLGITPKEQP